MISFSEASLVKLSIHQIDNELHNKKYILSEKPVLIENDFLNRLLIQYFLGQYNKINDLYRFYHSSNNLSLNEAYHYAESIFNNHDSFHENSEQFAKHLHEVSNHPKIKSGELYVAYFKHLEIDGDFYDAIGLFKSENKETYLKVQPEKNGFNLSYEQDGININKLDKGCLIFNTEKENGYKIAVLDQTNRSAEAIYWKDDFLKLKPINDNYNQTQNVLGLYKNFVTAGIDEEFTMSKTDKIDLLNKSIKYFKEKETFELDEFSNEVIGDKEGINSFLKYKKTFEQESESPISDTFNINNAAVKKQSRIYKSVLKLDKNFHIYIHGNKDLIEKGFDEDKSLSYYKVYFKEEE